MKSYKLLPLLVVTLASYSPIVFAEAKGEISMERAQQIALKRVKGTIRSSEYEFEKGQNVYSFDIDGSDGKIHEILVSAKSGKVVASSIESKAKEEAEKISDQKKEQD